jgi:hypothetical protein
MILTERDTNFLLYEKMAICGLSPHVVVVRLKLEDRIPRPLGDRQNAPVPLVASVRAIAPRTNDMALVDPF